MTAPERTLPAGFAALEPFVARWAVERSAARARLRLDSSAAEREAFYGQAVALLPAALALLDAKPLAELDAAERRLMQLMLSLAHVSLAVEVQGSDEAKHAAQAVHLRILRTPADAAA